MDLVLLLTAISVVIAIIIGAWQIYLARKQVKQGESKTDRQTPQPTFAPSSTESLHKTTLRPFDARYDLYHSTIRYDPIKFCYHFYTVRTIVNLGTQPITRDLHYLWCNHFPGQPERSERYYNKNPLRWEDISFRAWDDMGMLDVEVLNSLGSRIDYSVLFRHGRQQRPIYPNERRNSYNSYSISCKLFGPYYERYVHLPIKNLIIEVRFPMEYKLLCWGYSRSELSPSTPIQPPIKEYDDQEANERVFRWESTEAIQGHTYGLAWHLEEVLVKEEEPL
jgi:hypothetical protein